jgi:lipoprotein-anchoring transpeptidase ErfK/SrfK
MCNVARAPAVLLCASVLTAAAVTAAPAVASTPQCRGGVLHPVGTPAAAYSAEARGRITVYRRQDRGPLAVFPRLTWSRYPTTFWIVGAIVNKACAASWYRVKLPIRPNGAVGYVRPAAVDVARVTTSIAVDLSRRTLSFYRRGQLVLTTRVAVGSSATRTPIGRYFVSQRIRVSDADGPYGPAVLGVSAFSTVATGWARGGPIAIHGTNAPWSIGLAASNGCIRVPNATLMRLFAVTPAGTPVTIHP